jgi:hypothetical protein
LSSISPIRSPDTARAQKLLDRQLQINWPLALEPLVRQCHPLADEICRPLALSYYWSIDQSDGARERGDGRAAGMALKRSERVSTDGRPQQRAEVRTYATDLMFKSPAALGRVYPSLVNHGLRHFGTPEVLRFLDRVIPAHGRVHRLYKGEVETHIKHRPECVRLGPVCRAIRGSMRGPISSPS